MALLLLLLPLWLLLLLGRLCCSTEGECEPPDGDERDGKPDDKYGW